MHSDAQFAGSSCVPAHVEMMGLIGAGNNPMVGMTVAVAVSIEEAAPVSYTHLDVYKRQVQHRSEHRSYLCYEESRQRCIRGSSGTDRRNS